VWGHVKVVVMRWTKGTSLRDKAGGPTVRVVVGVVVVNGAELTLH
jgi:hypothetical protein